MTRALIRCDGASVPASLTRNGLEAHDLVSAGPGANLNLHVEIPSTTLLTSVDELPADLVRIAAFVYAADQLVRRGGKTDVYGDSWHREFHMCVPVSTPDFWARDDISELLREVLQFGTGDNWSFHYSPSKVGGGQVNFQLDPNAVLGDPDCLFMFSGGIDSLCAVVEANVEQGRRPVLVGHSPAFNIRSRQRGLAKSLKARFGRRWHFPLLSVAIHRSGSDAREYSQRSRGFLYAVLGVVFAQRLGFPEAALADNGVVSLALPTNEQLVGTKVSRSTHPKFLLLFNSLAERVFDEKCRVVNPLWSRTRAEGLQVLKAAQAEPLLEEANSCSHPRNLTRMQPHCGVCSQCIDRRFATLAAGLEDHDPPESYEVDIFRGQLVEGEPRTTAVSYVRFARELARLVGEDLFLRFEELFDCVPPGDADQRVTAEAITSMLSRHGAAVLRVIEDQIARNRSDLAIGRLPSSCLLRLVTGPDDLHLPAHFRPSPDYRAVWLGEERIDLSLNQARVVELLHKNDDTSLSQAYILETLEIRSSSLYQVFRTSPAAWKKLIRKVAKGVYALNL